MAYSAGLSLFEIVGDAVTFAATWELLMQGLRVGLAVAIPAIGDAPVLLMAAGTIHITVFTRAGGEQGCCLFMALGAEG